MATDCLVSVRLHSLSPFSVTAPLFLPRFSRTHSTRVTYPLGGEKIKKKKKKYERTVQEKRAFLRLDTERLSGAAEETDGATPSVDGQATSLARYRPFLLRACAALRCSVNKNDTCFYLASMEILYVKSRLSETETEKKRVNSDSRNLISSPHLIPPSRDNWKRMFL